MILGREQGIRSRRYRVKYLQFSYDASCILVRLPVDKARQVLLCSRLASDRGLLYLKANQTFTIVIAVMIAMLVQEFNSIAFAGDTSSMRAIDSHSYAIVCSPASS